MNAPDITLLIQVLHFIVAYTVLRKCVFAPALKILNKQEKDKAALRSSIEETGLVKDDALKKLHGRWHYIKQSLYKLMPFVRVKHLTSSKDTHQQQEPTQQKLSTSERASLKKIITSTVSEVDA